MLRRRTAPRTYVIERRLGVGGMGEVYLARSLDLEAPVALKRMIESDTSVDLESMFLREVAVAATLEHPNIVEVIDAGEVGRELYMVMELVEGPTLAEVIRTLYGFKRVLPAPVACAIASNVARALAHAHERSLPDGTPLGIIHRDVAPENVLITPTGLPKLVDFGLAKLTGHSLTQPGTVRGRPRSLSPEQARGEAVDGRADVFGLGAMLFEMLCGQPLYTQESVATLIWKVAAGAYDPIAPRLPHVDPDLVAILEAALAVDLDARIRSAREFERRLDKFRAARELRVDASAIVKLVEAVWPRVLADRAEQMAGSVGELEGTKLVIPADNFDASSEVELPPEEPSAAGTQARGAPKKPTSGNAGGTGKKGGPIPESTVPKPRAPRSQGEGAVGRGGYGWAIYFALVVAGAFLVSFVVWRLAVSTT